MMISSVGPSLFPQTSALVANLRTNGLTLDKAALVAKDAKAAVQQVGGVKRGPEGKAALRDALKERISADVASGALSAADANAVFQTFAQMDPANQNGGRQPGAQGGSPNGGDGAPPAQDGDTPPPDAAGAPPAKGAHGPRPKGGGGGGGGQGSASKTVLSESTTVTGPLQTTITVYTDGTSDTKTEAASTSAASTSNMYSKSSITAQGNANQASANGAAANNGAAKVQTYLSTIQPGSLFDFLVQ